MPPATRRRAPPTIVGLSPTEVEDLVHRGDIFSGALHEGDRPEKRYRAVDLRSRGAFHQDHLRGAVSIPAARLASSLFLLPPRRRRLLLLARTGGEAFLHAGRLAERGFLNLAFLEGATRNLEPSVRATGRQPNRIWESAPLLRAADRFLPPSGPACDLACGSGRNAVHLALRGYEVLGVDILPEALQQARRLAREAGTLGPRRVRFARVDLTEVRSVERVLRAARFKVVTCIRYLDRTLLPVIERALLPGGVLLFETFLEEQARLHGRPRRPEFLLKPGELRRAFPSLEVLWYREGPDESDDHLASLIARS